MKLQITRTARFVLAASLATAGLSAAPSPLAATPNARSTAAPIGVSRGVAAMSAAELRAKLNTLLQEPA